MEFPKKIESSRETLQERCKQTQFLFRILGATIGGLATAVLKITKEEISSLHHRGRTPHVTVAPKGVSLGAFPDSVEEFKW